MLAPIIYSNLTKWETGYEETHATEFTKEDLIRLHASPNTEKTLLWKSYSSIATSNAARSGGTWSKDFANIISLSNPNSAYPTYQNVYVREKKRGKTKRTDKDSFITGELETKVILANN